MFQNSSRRRGGGVSRVSNGESLDFEIFPLNAQSVSTFDSLRNSSLFLRLCLITSTLLLCLIAFFAFQAYNTFPTINYDSSISSKPNRVRIKSTDPDPIIIPNSVQISSFPNQDNARTLDIPPISIQPSESTTTKPSVKQSPPTLPPSPPTILRMEPPKIIPTNAPEPPVLHSLDPPSPTPFSASKSALNVLTPVSKDTLVAAIPEETANERAAAGDSRKRVTVNDSRLGSSFGLPPSTASQDRPRIRCILTNRHERICVYTPLCMNAVSGLPIIALDSVDQLECFRMTKLGSFLRHTSKDACLQMVTGNLREAQYSAVHANLESPAETTKLMDTWNSPKTVRIDDGDVLMKAFSNSDMNIAHYGGHVLFVHHILQHASRYGLVNTPTHVLLASPPRWNLPNSWHYGVTASAVYPLKMPEGVVQGMQAIRQPGVHIVQRGKISTDESDAVCFRSGILPAFLKGRNFITDAEIALSNVAPNVNINGAWKSTNTDDSTHFDPNEIPVPSDAQIFRKRVGEIYFGDSNAIILTKQVVYLTRGQGKRGFSVESDAMLKEMCEKLCSAMGWKFSVLEAGRLSFKEQVDGVRHASVLLGMHGANLINSMFAPARGHLIELFPYGFNHNMYVDGLGSGLSYDNYTLVTEPIPHPLLSKFEGNLYECQRKSNDCKVYYRADGRRSNLTQSDLNSIETLVRNAIERLNPLIIQ